MNYKEWIKLVDAGEKRNVDFKILCHAFEPSNPDSESSKAELAKDICAMANNGGQASYILIGVGNNAKSFKEVSNAQLTDDNLQSFCKTAIFPPPHIRLLTRKWSHSSTFHSGKSFVVIQIGPNPRHAYRLNRDFIDLKASDPHKRYSFRRNEVWIRRQATSDLATPEEILSLVKGKSAQNRIVQADDIDFTRLPLSEQVNCLAAEVRKSLGAHSANVLTSKSGMTNFQIALTIRKERFVFRCLVLTELSTRGEMMRLVRECWQYEHGFVFFTKQGVSKVALPREAQFQFKEVWGQVSEITLKASPLCEFWIDDGSGLRTMGYPHDRLLAKNFSEAGLTLFALPKLETSREVNESIASLFEFLKSDDEAFNRLVLSARKIDENLKNCLGKGWLRTVSWARHGQRPRKGHFLSRKFPDRILKRDKARSLVAMAKKILREVNAMKRGRS